MKKSILILTLLTSLFSTNVLAATNKSTSFAADLNTGLPATVLYGSWLAGTKSTFNVVISDLPENADIQDGIYNAWCIQDHIAGALKNEAAILYASTSESLPSDISDLPWNQINYVLNHKIRGDGKSNSEFSKDVQTAIWLLLGDTDPEFGVNRPEALQMVADANAHSDYVPGEGEITAVVIYSDGMSTADTKSVQEAIIEVILHHLPTETATPPTETATPPTETATPPTETATPPTETATPPLCQPTVVKADFSNVPVGQSVEGMGVVAPDLNIDAIGTAVKILESTEPTGYGAPNGNTIANGGLDSSGGFSDIETRLAMQAHQYTFTFASGTSASNFSLHMLDFGDWNPTSSKSHYVSATAYDINGLIVTKQEIKYTTPAVVIPHSSSKYGDVWVTGDAINASPGELGNWTWNVSGSGIVRVELEFGAGFDPAIGLDLLSFTTECP